MVFLRSLSRRDIFLVLLGAVSLHLFTLIFPSALHSTHDQRLIIANPHIDHPPADTNPLPPPPEAEPDRFKNTVQHNVHTTEKESKRPHTHVSGAQVKQEIIETTLVSHAYGWTIFRNLYMADGTVFIVSRHPSSYFPDIRFMTSTGLPAENTPENIKLREPTKKDMAIISPEEARHRWGPVKAGEPYRVWAVEGNTVRVFLLNSVAQPTHCIAPLFHSSLSMTPHNFCATTTTSSPSSSLVPGRSGQALSHNHPMAW